VTFAIDVVFFAPAFERCLAAGPHSKKTVGTRKELVSKQTHLMWGRALKSDHLLTENFAIPTCVLSKR